MQFIVCFRRSCPSLVCKACPLQLQCFIVTATCIIASDLLAPIHLASPMTVMTIITIIPIIIIWVTGVFRLNFQSVLITSDIYDNRHTSSNDNNNNSNNDDAVSALHLLAGTCRIQTHRCPLKVPASSCCTVWLRSCLPATAIEPLPTPTGCS